MIYEIVKQAIDKKIKIHQYYLDDNKFLYFQRKAIAAKNINDPIKTIYKINNKNDYAKIIKNGTISIYEPVDSNINNFRIFIKNASANESFPILLTIKKRFEEIGLDAQIIKSGNNYGIKCVSKNNYNTNKLYAFAGTICKGLDIDLSELSMGELKRAYYSLDDNGNEDVVINIVGVGIK